jgi:Tfp pilus assembly protein PilN
MQSWKIRAGFYAAYRRCLEVSQGLKAKFFCFFGLSLLLILGLWVGWEKQSQQTLKNQLALLPQAEDIRQAQAALQSFQARYRILSGRQAYKKQWLRVLHEIFVSHTSGCLLTRLSIQQDRAILLGFAQTQAKLTELTLSLASQSALSMPRLLQLQPSQQQAGFDFSIQLDLDFDDHS